MGQNINNNKIETPIVLYRLWLAIAKNVSVDRCSQQLCNKLANGFKEMRGKILIEDCVVYLEIVEEYIIGGVVTLDEAGMLDILTDIR